MADIFRLLQWAFGKGSAPERSTSSPQLLPLQWGQIDLRQIETLNVLISSPVNSLEKPRELLKGLIDRLPGVHADIFEFQARTGATAQDVCRKFIERADVVVVLIGNDIGTPVQGVASSFSKWEHDLMKARQSDPSSSGRPRVLVYKHKVERELSEWEIQLEKDYSAETCDDPQELAALIVIEVAATLLLERKEQARALYALRDVRQRELQRWQSERSALNIELETSARAVVLAADTSKAKVTFLENQLGHIKQAEETRESRVKVAEEDLKKELRARSILVSVVTALSLLCIVVVVSLMKNGGDAKNLAAFESASNQQTEGLGTIAGAIHALAEHLTTPSEVTAAKIRLATALNNNFDCSIHDQSDWSALDIPGSRFSRSEVCESTGAFILRIKQSTGKCQFSSLTQQSASKLLKTILAAHVDLALVRIIGHASRDPIVGSCGSIPDDLLPASSSTSESDKQIRNNTELAWARAAYAEHMLRTSTPSIEPFPALVVAALGVFGRPADTARSYWDAFQGVDIELFLKPHKW